MALEIAVIVGFRFSANCFLSCGQRIGQRPQRKATIVRDVYISNRINAMARAFRTIPGFLFVLPIVFSCYCLMPLLGRHRSVRITGKLLARMTAAGLGMLVPTVSGPADFDVFRRLVKRNFTYMAPIYDLVIMRDEPDIIGFNVRHCPVADALTRLGLSELRPFACAGDWRIAQNHKEKWDFIRQHSLGTDGIFCDHTYMRNGRVCTDFRMPEGRREPDSRTESPTSSVGTRRSSTAARKVSG